MRTWKLKSCPRCGGDVYIDRGMDTWYEECLQCGYVRELREIHEVQAQLKREKELVPARISPSHRK